MAPKAHASELVVGGWDNGVLNAFKVFRVLSSAM